MNLKRACLGVIALLMLLVSGSLRAQNPAAAKPLWLDLGQGRGFYEWIVLVPGVGAKTDTDLYLSTYDKALGKDSANNIAAAQAAAFAVRSNAEHRLRTALEQFKQHDPQFFQKVMEEQELILLNSEQGQRSNH